MCSLKVGVGREIITPPLGTALYGYSPVRYAKAVNDDLTVTAIAFEHENTKALLVSATICTINTVMFNKICNLIEEKYGIPSDNIIIEAIHTHSGPATNAFTGWGTINYEYYDTIFIPRTLKAIGDSLDDLRPAVIGIGTACSDIGINRRQINADGNVELGQNPWGIYDPTMTVISIKGTDGLPIANIIHYGAHCTAAGRNEEITRDWAGVMIDRMEKETGAITAFLNGAEGDVGPRLSNGKTTGDLSYSFEIGSKAALDAVRIYNSIKEYRELMVIIDSHEVKLPYEPLPTIEEAERHIKALGNPDMLKERDITAYQRWQDVINENNSTKPKETDFSFRQVVLSIGPVAMVTSPFELFSEIVMRLRHYSPFEYTLCLSNSNGSCAYLPSQDQICRGGYEIQTFKTVRTYSLADNSDEYFIKGSLEQLYKSKCKMV